jgi:hypothetical protein
MMASAQISLFVGTTGVVLPFVLTDRPLSAGGSGAPISNATSLTVTWINTQGGSRTLSLSNAASGVFTYTVSAGDTRSPHSECGYLQVSNGTARYFTSSFTMRVVPLC